MENLNKEQEKIFNEKKEQLVELFRKKLSTFKNYYTDCTIFYQSNYREQVDYYTNIEQIIVLEYDRLKLNFNKVIKDIEETIRVLNSHSTLVKIKYDCCGGIPIYIPLNNDDFISNRFEEVGNILQDYRHDIIKLKEDRELKKEELSKIEKEINQKKSDLDNIKEEISNLQEYKDIISLVGDISLKDIIESLINKGK